MKEYKFWTVEEENLLIKLSGTMSFEEMAKQFPNRNATKLQHKAIKLGLVSGYRKKTHYANPNLWDVPNLLNCYYGGNFMADGCLQKKGKTMIFTLQVCTKDICIIKNFKKFSDFTGNIKSIQRKSKTNNNIRNVSYMRISCANEWEKPLKDNFGIIPLKTFRAYPPNLDNMALKLAFIIGNLDGDGSICVDSKKGATLRFYSCNTKVLGWIKSTLEEFLGEKAFGRNGERTIRNTWDKNGITKTHEFSISGKDAIFIIDYLRQFPVPKLDRKWNKPELLETIKRYKEKYPEYYINPLPIPSVTI